MDDQSHAEQMEIRHVSVGHKIDGYRPVMFDTDRGDVQMRYYKEEDQALAVMMVGGVGGGFDTPARGLYPKLAGELASHGIATLRLRFRYPTLLDESVLDCLAGIKLLEGEGMRSIGLVGHSFGGAAVIQAATAFPTVRTVVTLATQSYGTHVVDELGPRCSMLLMHGTADPILPVSCTKHVYENAQEPKRLVLYEGATHKLDEVADDVLERVRNWLVGRLYERDIEDWRWGVGTEGPAITE